MDFSLGAIFYRNSMQPIFWQNLTFSKSAELVQFFSVVVAVAVVAVDVVVVNVVVVVDVVGDNVVIVVGNVVIVVDNVVIVVDVADDVAVFPPF